MPKAAPKPAAPARRKKAANAPDVVPPPALPDDPKQRELLAALWADPDSDDARLVYADWLLEHGDPRGEFITESVREEQIQDWNDPKKKEAGAKAEKLRKKHEKEWVAPIRPYIRSWSWRRGFLSRVTCDGGLFVEGAAAICAVSPDLYVEITGLKPKQVPGLAAAPLGKLYSLSLSQQRLDDEQGRILFASPTLAGLRELDLSHNALRGPAMQALASNPVRTSLRSLRVDNVAFLDDGPIALAASPGFPELRELRMSAGWNKGGFGAAGARALAASKAFPRLESLSIGGHAIGDEGADALAQSTTLPPRLRIFAENCGISDAAKRRLDARFPPS